MTGEELSGPPGQKIVRLLSFMGAGVICAFAINKWREFERRTVEQQQQGKPHQNQLPDSKSNVVQEELK